MEEAKIKIDVKDISEAGFDNRLYKTRYGQYEAPIGATSRYTSVRNLSGGRFTNQSELYLGGRFVKVDNRNNRHLVSDGANYRVLIGKF